MIKNLKLVTLGLFVIGALVLTGVSNANEESSSSGETSAKKLGIIFPIAELGSCSGIEECKTYCSDPKNQEACVNFAKKKGFYKQRSAGKENMQQILEKAKVELGCNSTPECRAFCSKEDNHKICKAFFLKHKLENKTHEGTPGGQILEKAKQFLGCESYEACKAFCEDQSNKEKCSQFSKMPLLRGEKPASEDGHFKGPKDASHSGEKFTPNSLKAFEHVNENARFCREHPDRCKNASGAAIENHQRPNSEGYGPRNFKPGLFIKDDEEGEDEVKGVSTSVSFLQQIWHFFFK